MSKLQNCRGEILVADDDVCVAFAIANLLATTFVVHPPVNSLPQLWAALGSSQPSAVLLDISFGSQSALVELPALVKAFPEISYVCFTGHAEGALESVAFANGAFAYLRKCCGKTELFATLERALANRKGVERGDNPPHRIAVASNRARTVLALRSHGLTNREIAERLRVSEKAIEYHVRKLKLPPER